MANTVYVLLLNLSTAVHCLQGVYFYQQIKWMLFNATVHFTFSIKLKIKCENMGLLFWVTTYCVLSVQNYKWGNMTITELKTICPNTLVWKNIFVNNINTIAILQSDMRLNQGRISNFYAESHLDPVLLSWFCFTVYMWISNK